MQFLMKQHLVRPNTMVVEVYNDTGDLIATISPHDQGIHIVSKYMTGQLPTIGIGIPGVLVVLDSAVCDPPAPVPPAILKKYIPDPT